MNEKKEGPKNKWRKRLEVTVTFSMKIGLGHLPKGFIVCICLLCKNAI
jgi:hypothetical protein